MFERTERLIDPVEEKKWEVEQKKEGEILIVKQKREKNPSEIA